MTTFTSTVIDLPALDGREPLGFLAACGVLRLLSSDGGQAPRLSFDPVRGSARLHLRLDAAHGGDPLDGVVQRLHRVATGIGPRALLPGGAPGFPGPAHKGAPRNDGMRTPREQFRHTVEAWRAEMVEAADVWAPALVTDQLIDDKGCVVISPFAAPSGQQTFATMFDKSLRMVQRDERLVIQALTAWRRIDGVTGEYLDHHVLRSGADRSDGESVEIGVPGATWLALMALPLLPVWSDGAAALAGGWQRVGRGRRAMSWPLWSDAVDVFGLQVLIAHPSLRLRFEQDEWVCDASAMAGLSVFRVCAAARREIPSRTFAGVLAPITLKRGHHGRRGR